MSKPAVQFDLSALADPHSIAVVGASANPAKLGHAILKNLIDGGYPGKLYAVNRNGEDVLGVTGVGSIPDVSEAVDLAVIAIPANGVIEVTRQCGEKGLKAVAVIAAGFSEIGPEGAAVERELVAVVRKYGMRLLGPNCLGLIDTSKRLNASFAPRMPDGGTVSVLSQSGAMCTALLDWSSQSGIGFDGFVSIGNQAEVTESDWLERWTEDANTEVVAGYLESIPDGPRFLETARALTRRKPVIIAKAGRTEAGTKAAGSHTGALAGSDAVLDAALREVGVTRADSVQDLYDYLTLFTQSPLPAGGRVAIITNAGGPGVLTADAVAATDLTVAELSERTTRTLAKALPTEAATANPVDLIGDARASRYQVALSTVLGDRGVDAVLVVLTPQSMTEIPETAAAIINAATESQKPVIAVFMGGETVAPGIAALQAAGVPTYQTPDHAVRALVAYARYAAYRDRPHPVVKTGKPSRTARTILDESATLGETAIWGERAADILGDYGISAPRQRLVTTVEEAVTAADGIGYPVVLKIDSPDILHKSDVGGVATGLGDRAAVEAAYGEMLARIKKSQPKATLRGVTVSPQIADGLDLLVGASRDRTFGTVVAFGLGGIYVEAVGDVAFGLAPLDDRSADRLIAATKASRILGGLRGETFDQKAVRKALVGVSRLIDEFPEIAELDLNPLRVSAKGAVSLDTRIILADSEPAR